MTSAERDKPTNIPAADHEVGRPAVLPSESTIEYGLRCIEWERARSRQIIEAMRGQRHDEGWDRALDDTLAAIRGGDDA